MSMDDFRDVFSRNKSTKEHTVRPISPLTVASINQQAMSWQRNVFSIISDFFLISKIIQRALLSAYTHIRQTDGTEGHPGEMYKITTCITHVQ